MRRFSGWRMTWIGAVLPACLALASAQTDAGAITSDDQALVEWSERFSREVDHRLDVPLAEQAPYIEMIEKALAKADLTEIPTQSFVLVDSSLQVQAAIVLVRKAGGGWTWIGATAVSTGKVGTYDHFVTPLGVFPHTLDNPDFRAQGTFNKNHIRGYGVRGRRIFDFGWQLAERGWGDGGTSQMRLQMHATDPHVLEARLGRMHPDPGDAECLPRPARYPGCRLRSGTGSRAITVDARSRSHHDSLARALPGDR